MNLVEAFLSQSTFSSLSAFAVNVPRLISTFSLCASIPPLTCKRSLPGEEVASKSASSQHHILFLVRAPSDKPDRLILHFRSGNDPAIRCRVRKTRGEKKKWISPGGRARGKISWSLSGKSNIQLITGPSIDHVRFSPFGRHGDGGFWTNSL